MKSLSASVLPGTVRSPGVEYDSGMSNDKRPRRLLAAIVVLAVLLGGAVLVLVLGPARPPATRHRLSGCRRHRPRRRRLPRPRLGISKC